MLASASRKRNTWCGAQVAPSSSRRASSSASRSRRFATNCSSRGSEVAVVAALVAAEMHLKMHERDRPRSRRSNVLQEGATRRIDY
jgi:hypothetical protein